MLKYLYCESKFLYKTMNAEKIIKIIVAVVIGFILVKFVAKIFSWIFWVALIGVGAYIAYEVLFNKKQVK